MVLATAYTPTSTGADAAELTVPHEYDGTLAADWTVRRVNFRVGTAGGSPSVQLQKSTSAGVFSPADLVTVTLGSNAYEGYAAGIFGTATSGDKLRMNVLELGTAQNWTVTVQLYHPFS
jgi:hypothetical protein